MGSTPHKLVLLLFIFLLTLSSIKEVLGSIPLSIFIFPFNFLKKFLCSLHLMRSWVQFPMNSQFFKKFENIAHFSNFRPRQTFPASRKCDLFQSIFLSSFNVDSWSNSVDIFPEILPLYEHHIFDIYIYENTTFTTHKYKAAT